MANHFKRLNVPYPPRGHWAKKEAEKPVVRLALSRRLDGAPDTIDIRARLRKPDQSSQVEETVTTLAERVPDFASTPSIRRANRDPDDVPPFGRDTIWAHSESQRSASPRLPLVPRAHMLHDPAEVLCKTLTRASGWWTRGSWTARLKVGSPSIAEIGRFLRTHHNFRLSHSVHCNMGLNQK